MVVKVKKKKKEKDCAVAVIVPDKNVDELKKRIVALEDYVIASKPKEPTPWYADWGIWLLIIVTVGILAYVYYSYLLDLRGMRIVLPRIKLRDYSLREGKYGLSPFLAILVARPDLARLS